MAQAPTRASDQFNEMEQSGKVVKSYDSGTGKAYRDYAEMSVRVLIAKPQRVSMDQLHPEGS